MIPEKEVTSIEYYQLLLVANFMLANAGNYPPLFSLNISQNLAFLPIIEELAINRGLLQNNFDVRI